MEAATKPDKVLDAVLYSRVSTRKQVDSLAGQVAELRDYAARRPDLHIVGEYSDSGVSGAKASRPQLDQVMQLARARTIGAVVVTKLDRWGRSLQHLVNSVVELQQLGVAFISIKDGIDLSTSSGRLMFGVLSCMAEFERSLIRERVQAGVDRVLRSGKTKTGRPYGRPEKLVNHSHLLGLRAAGWSYPRIARELGLSVGKVYKEVKA